MKYLKRLLIALVIGIICLGAVAYAWASAMLYFRFATVIPRCDGQFAENTPANFSLGDFGEDIDVSAYWMPDYEIVDIPSRQPDIHLSGWYIPAETSDAPAVLVIHGLGAGVAECKRHPRALFPAGMLHRAGFNVLMIDMRDHGASTIDDGMWGAGSEEYQDVLGAWDWLQAEKDISAEDIGIFAYSGGTAGAMIAMGEEPDIAAIWLDSPLTEIHQGISDLLERNGYPRFLTPGGVAMARILSNDVMDAYSPIAATAKIDHRPAFVVHGDADQTLPVEYGYTMAEKLGLSEDQLWIAPDCNHIQAMFKFHEQYEQRLASFFDEALRG
jgi:uncharacterized protein